MASLDVDAVQEDNVKVSKSSVDHQAALLKVVFNQDGSFPMQIISSEDIAYQSNGKDDDDDAGRVEWIESTQGSSDNEDVITLHSNRDNFRSKSDKEINVDTAHVTRSQVIFFNDVANIIMFLVVTAVILAIYVLHYITNLAVLILSSKRNIIKAVVALIGFLCLSVLWDYWRWRRQSERLVEYHEIPLPVRLTDADFNDRDTYTPILDINRFELFEEWKLKQWVLSNFEMTRNFFRNSRISEWIFNWQGSSASPSPPPPPPPPSPVLSTASTSKCCCRRRRCASLGAVAK